MVDAAMSARQSVKGNRAAGLCHHSYPANLQVMPCDQQAAWQTGLHTKQVNSKIAV